MLGDLGVVEPGEHGWSVNSIDNARLQKIVAGAVQEQEALLKDVLERVRRYLLRSTGLRVLGSCRNLRLRNTC